MKIIDHKETVLAVLALLVFASGLLGFLDIKTAAYIALAVLGVEGALGGEEISKLRKNSK